MSKNKYMTREGFGEFKHYIKSRIGQLENKFKTHGHARGIVEELIGEPAEPECEKCKMQDILTEAVLYGSSTYQVKFEKCDTVKNPEPKTATKPRINITVAEEKLPDPPLRVWVAKALGYLYFHAKGETWYMKSREDTDWAHRIIPNYDTDIKLAMQALEEYATSQKTSYQIFRIPETPKYTERIDIHIGMLSIKNYRYDSLPEAICLAIVKHAEGK